MFYKCLLRSTRSRTGFFYESEHLLQFCYPAGWLITEKSVKFSESNQQAAGIENLVIRSANLSRPARVTREAT